MADIGHGTTISFGAFTGQLRNVSLQGRERASIDVTHMASLEKWMEFIPGLKNAGEAVLNVIFDPSVTPPIEQAKGTVTITFPSGRKWAHDGFCTGMGEEIPHDQLMEQDVTIKFSGKPDFNAA